MMSEPKRWQNGTLSYTSTSLTMLFFMLLMGDFSWALKDRSVQQILQLLLKENGASDTINAILTMSLPMGLTLILTPIACYWSDRCRTSWGRRIPFLLIMTPIAAGAIGGMGFSSDLGALVAKEGFCTVKDATIWFLGIFWALFEFATVVSLVLFTSLVNDVVPHKLLGRFYGLFRFISLGAGVIFNNYFFGYASQHPKLLFIWIAVIYFAGFMLMCFKVKEGQYAAPEPVNGNWFAPVKEYFKEGYSKPYYLLIFFFDAMRLTLMAPIANFAMFYAKSLNVPMDTFGKAFAVTFGIALICAYPVGWLADKIHPLRISIIMLFVYGVVAVSAFFIVHDQATFLVFFVLIVATAGVYLTGSASLMLQLLPQKNFATVSSAGGLLSSLAYMLAMPLVGIFLDKTGHCYNYLYPLGGIGCALTGCVGLWVYKEFKKYGGVKNYQAP